jgi:mRNA-degrading endonuclease RelE of RelBE toxin-antitoxin system
MKLQKQKTNAFAFLIILFFILTLDSFPQQNQPLSSSNKKLISQEFKIKSEFPGSIQHNYKTSNRTNAYRSILDGVRKQKMAFCGVDNAFDIEYSITGTEIINNHEYFRFDADNLIGYPPYSFFLREDTLSGKLWVYDEIEEREWLAIDMGLELNDSFLLSSRYANYYDTITFVDSIFYDNEGHKHLRFNLSCFNFALSPNYNKLEFIEGIGTNFGLGYQVINSIDDFYQEILLCAFKDDEKIYSHNSESGDSCKLIINGVGIENIYQSGLKVWPNPCQKTVNVNPPFGYFGYGTILIRDIAGKLVYSKSIQCFEFGIIIDMSLFKPGKYIIETKLNNCKIYQNKLIRLQ